MIPSLRAGTRIGRWPAGGSLQLPLLGCLAILCWPLTIATGGASLAAAQTAAGAEQRCVLVEVYYRPSDPAARERVDAIVEFLRAKRGVQVRVREIDAESTAQDRLDKITKHFKVQKVTLPLVYASGQVLMDLNDDRWQQRLDDLFRVNVYVRSGCPHCADAERFLTHLSAKYPALEFRYRDVASDIPSREAMQRLTRQYRRTATTVPVFHFCNELLVGFDSSSGMGRKIEEVLTRWTCPCPKPEPGNEQGGAVESDSPRNPPLHQRDSVQRVNPVSAPLLTSEPGPSLQQVDESRAPEAELPLPGGPSEDTSAEPVRVPFWGELDVGYLGLPLFTIAVGLVDGFNPCAMWVLLFLLSLLVNLQDRRKILAVAGTFVVISGLAYFAFMAAWLNVFLLFGLLRWAQVLLSLLAIGVGAIHIKDFFAFRRGISLSIPESAKPGIYARVRRIVLAENLLGATAGAAVLAVLVNVIELLCTAGLPAMYTEILTLRQLPLWQNYLYLGLYIAAYMFDDSMMVGLVVITLGRRKMQETHGRWLKLLSGGAILLLGLVMLLRPQWLV